MGKRLRRCPVVEDRDTEGTMSSVRGKTKTRNAASDVVAADDSKVNSKESKVKKVRKKVVTRTRKGPCDDGMNVVDEPMHLGCDDKGKSIDVAACVDVDVDLKNVANSSEFSASKDTANPDSISPAAKLAKQLRCFKDKQSVALNVIFGGRQSPTEFDCATGKRTRKRKGNAIPRNCHKPVSANADHSSLGEPTVSVHPGSPAQCKHLVDHMNKRSRKPRANAKVKQKPMVEGSPKQHDGTSGCVDPQNLGGAGEGEHRVTGRKRRSTDKAVNSTGKKGAAKAAKISVVDSCIKKTKQKQSVPRNRNKQPKVLGRRSASPGGEMETEVAVTGGGDCLSPHGGAGPSGEGEVAESGSDSESDWEEVDELPGANMSVRDQLPRGPVEIILEAPTLKRGKHKEIDIKTYFRRLMNRYKKETQLDMHKVHLLCLLCYGFHRNEICKDVMLQAVTLSLVPARFVDVREWDVSLLGKLTGWFKGHFSIDPHLPGNTNHLVAALVSGVTQASVSSQTELVFVFVAMLRSLGLDVRLVISLQPVPIKATDLDTKTSAGNSKKTTSSGQAKNKSVKKDSKRESRVKTGSRRVTSKEDLRTNDGIKQKLDIDEMKQEGVTLSAKNGAKCKVKAAVRTTGEERGLGDEGYVQAEAAGGCPGGGTQSEGGRPRRRMSRVNYNEVTQQEDGDEASEAGHPSQDEDSGNEDLLTGGGKGKGTQGRVAAEEEGSVQEISDDDDDFVEETVKMRLGSQAQKPARQKRTVAESDSEDSVTLDKDGAGTDHWTEVFLPCEQSWICVDCVHVRVAEPEKMERRATSPIRYVVAYDNNNCVKDVTSRYASDWMHSTRKLRVAPKWWQAVLASYCDPDLDREKKENIELKAKFTEEPLPTAIGQYKNHPLYALRRHLLKFEAIYPPTALVLGYVRGEPVYSRECVHNLHSRETWLKEGLVVKVGEEPYKMVRARPKWHKPHENTTDPTLPIFGRWQTETYVAPPAVDGKVPVNEYGNVELFQPSMLPAGTVHIRVPGLQKVAKKLNIDCPPAMMGWDFHGGYNHPVMDGWVVCEEHKEILLAAWDEDQEIQRQRDLEKREARAVDNWKLLVKGLLIKQRLKHRYDLQETASGSGGKTEDRLDPRPATDTALSWPQNRRQTQPKSQNGGALFPFEMEHM